MEIVPAIDILQGQCVRLCQGEYGLVTAYAEDPLTMAEGFKANGAKKLHIVDLNGAKDGLPIQHEYIKSIKNSVNMEIQVGGGIRNLEQVEWYLNHGIDRVIIGSIAVNDPELVRTWIKQISSERIVFALDVLINEDQIPMLVTHGWMKKSNKSIYEFLELFLEYDGINILCTDVMRDGTLRSPNFGLYCDLVKVFPQFKFQASGGVQNLADLAGLKQCKVNSVIVGKAFYEK